jgi:hypothetical protein
MHHDSAMKKMKIALQFSDEISAISCEGLHNG